jgi:hypothetical protein
MWRMWRFLAVLRSFNHSSLLRTFSCHPSPPNILPSSLTSSCHLFLCLPLNLVVPKFIYTVGHEKVACLPFCTCLATVLISVFTLCYGPGLLFRGPLCMILFWESYFLPTSVHVQTNVIYLTLLSLL